MAIGVFDCGVGGLTVHRELTRRFPERDFIYLADQANAPDRRSKTGEEIVDLTRDGCERLFEAGASVIVLACNTASAVALRRLQQTWVPEASKRHGRPVNVLGIIVPTIEAATGLPWTYEAERRGRQGRGHRHHRRLLHRRHGASAASMRSRSTSAARIWRSSPSPAPAWPD